MDKIVAGDPKTLSADVVAENLEHLKGLFPDAFAEGQIDFEVLKQLLGGNVDEREEKYGLNWHGKRQARHLALTPSTGTLRPCPDESVDWDTTQNLMIEGDNLEVLKLLQKSYSCKIKIICIDPPYNTGKDFIYPDDYRDSVRNYLALTGQTSNGNGKLTSNMESSGRFHTDWLNMIYPRLKLAYNLLTNDGLIFVSCDDNEVSRLRCLLDEIYGEENFISQIVWKKSYGGGSKTKHVVILHEYVLCFSKHKDAIQRLELPPKPETLKYYKHRDSKYEIRGPYRLQPLATTSNDDRVNLRYGIPYRGEEVWQEKQWQWKRERTMEALKNDDLVITKVKGRWQVNYKQYLRDENGIERSAKPFSVLDGPYTQTGTAEIAELFDDSKVFPFPKPSSLMAHFIKYAHPSKDFIVLDFFAGSGSTVEAVLRLNQEDSGHRRFICVQLPEPTGRDDYPTIAEITKERAKRVGTQLKSKGGIGDDLGFRVFKLDTSNVRAWEPAPEDLEAALLDGVEHIEANRTEQDILFELLLKLGLDLCVPIETKTVAGKTVHAVGAGTLIACLDEAITRADVEPLALGIADWDERLAPAGETSVVFRDSAFADDVSKTNLAAILEQRRLEKYSEPVMGEVPGNEPMPQRRRYKTPPIEEALCELRFVPGQQWDLTIPGKLQAQLGDEYSGKPREQKALQIGMKVREGKPENLQFGEGLTRVQLVTEDGTRMVGVGPDVVSIHMLHPYQNPMHPERSGWDEFEPRISTALNAYWSVAEPRGVSRVGMRYINKIAIPERIVKVENYLKCALLEADGLPEDYSNFSSRVEYLYKDKVRLVLSYGLLDLTPEMITILLDLDVIWEGNESVDRCEASNIAGDLRERVRAAFEAAITNKARELFDAN